MKKRQSGIGWWLAAGGFVIFALLVVAANQEATTTRGKESPVRQIGEPESINGISARDVPMIKTEAVNGKCSDWKVLKTILIKEDYESLRDFYSDKELGKCNESEEWEIPSNHRLTEYKANEDLYYYLLEYPSSTDLYNLQREFFKVIKTKEGWKTFHRYSKPAWEYETQDLDPLLIKGVHDQP